MIVPAVEEEGVGAVEEPVPPAGDVYHSNWLPAVVTVAVSCVVASCWQ